MQLQDEYPTLPLPIVYELAGQATHAFSLLKSSSTKFSWHENREQGPRKPNVDMAFPTFEHLRQAVDVSSSWSVVPRGQACLRHSPWSRDPAGGRKCPSGHAFVSDVARLRPWMRIYCTPQQYSRSQKKFPLATLETREFGDKQDASLL